MTVAFMFVVVTHSGVSSTDGTCFFDSCRSPRSFTRPGGVSLARR